MSVGHSDQRISFTYLSQEALLRSGAEWCPNTERVLRSWGRLA